MNIIFQNAIKHFFLTFSDANFVRVEMFMSVLLISVALPCIRGRGAYITDIGGHKVLNNLHSYQSDSAMYLRAEDTEKLGGPSWNAMEHIKSVQESFLSGYHDKEKLLRSRRKKRNAILLGVSLGIDLASYAIDIYELTHLTQESEVDKLERKVNKVQSIVSNVLTKLQSVQSHLRNIYNLIQLSYYQTIFTRDSRVIESCFVDYGDFILNPFSDILQSRMNTCYNHVRTSVENVMNVATVGSFHNEPFLNYTLATRGCNGNDINNIWTYIYGIVVEGCISMIAGQQMLFGNSSFSRVTECDRYFGTMENHLKTLYATCAMEHCIDIQSQILNSSVSFTNVSVIGSELSSLLPWFNITVLQLTPENSSDGQPFGTYELSNFTLEINKKKFAILWTSDATEYCRDNLNASTQTEFSLYGYGISKRHLVDYYNGIQLHVVSGLSTKHYFTGYGLNVSRTSKLCTLFWSNKVEGSSTSPKREDDNSGLVVAIVCGCIAGIVIFAIIAALVLCRKKNTNNTR